MWKEEFDKTKLATQGGSCWECCDYEDMVLEMEQFISSLLEKQKQEYEDTIMEIEKIHQEEIIKLLDR